MLNYDLIAKQIIQNVGGVSNYDHSEISGRVLTIFIKKTYLANKSALERISGILSASIIMGHINLLFDAAHVENVSKALNRFVHSEQYPKSNTSVIGFDKEKTTIRNKINKKTCPICNSILDTNYAVCNICGMVFEYAGIEQVNTVTRNVQNSPMTRSTQNNPVIINTFYNSIVHVNIENLDMSGLTFNQIIQYNGISQNAVFDIRNQINVYADFITYITKRVQYNDEMARDVIAILRSSRDSEVRNLGYDMQKESREKRNPLAKLRRWVLDHKDDADAAKKFIDALSSAAEFAKKWGPKLAKLVGL